MFPCSLWLSSQFNIRTIQRDWNKYFAASVSVGTASQKIIPVTRSNTKYLFYAVSTRDRLLMANT